MEQPTQNIFQRWYARAEAYVKANPTRSRNIAVIVGLLLLSIIVKLVVDVPQPHVSLAGQPLMQNGPSWFTNSLLTTFIVDIIILVLAWSATRNLSIVPSGLQNAMEAIIEFIYNLAESIAGKAAATYFPWVATLFFFVLVSNYTGLIPFVGSLGFLPHHRA